MKNIILTGFMASGKTTIGKALAKALDMNFIDTDEMIEKEQGLTVSEIFSRFGEEHFRKLEHECAKKLASAKNTVIATGGGFVLNKENIALLQTNGIVINLNTNKAVIRKRLKNARATRPLLDDDLKKILLRFAQRKEFYDNCDIQINLSNWHKPKHYTGVIIKHLDNAKRKAEKI